MAEMDLSDKHPGSGNKFQWLFLPGAEAPTALYDKVIEETQNFAVLPTRGSIVPGWVLIVPKFATSRIADVSESKMSELRDLLERVTSRLEKEFGTTFTFEHGGFQGSNVSCGVDQAHLHVASLNFDLVEAAKSASPGGWMHVGSDQLPPPEFSDGEYWFVSSGEVAMCKEIDLPISQFFRKIIAQKAEKAALWDYRTEDFNENVASTIKVMGANG